MEEMDESFDFEELEEQERPRKKKKKGKAWIAIVAGALAVAILAVGAFLLLPKQAGGESDSDEWTRTGTYIADDGSAAYIFLPGGESVKVKDDDILQVELMEDMRHLVVQLKDGTLYMSDRNQKNKWEIADDSTDFWLADNCLLYQGKNNRWHRADFEDRKIVDLPKDAYLCDVGSCSGKTSVAFVKNDNLYVLPDGAEEPVKLASHCGECIGLSGDGQIVVWTSYKDEKTTLYVSDGEEKISLDETNDYYGEVIVDVYFTKDQKAVIIVSDNKLWVKERDKDLLSVKFNNDLFSVTTDAGEIEDVNASQLKYIFVEAFDDDDDATNMETYNDDDDVTNVETYDDDDDVANVEIYDDDVVVTTSLYRISLKDGEKEKLLSKADRIIIYEDGVVLYRQDGDLYMVKIGKKELGEAEKIASDVKLFGLHGKGQYLYYLRDDVLYGCKIGSKEPTKIASDVVDYTVSRNGQHVVFEKDGSYREGYTLYLWKFGGKSPEKIATDSRDIRIENTGKLYYARIDGDTFDMMYYDGRESRKVASNLKDDLKD